MGWRLGQLENDSSALERRVDHCVTREELEATFRARDAILSREFVPRTEQQQKRDWNLRIWLGLISAGQLITAVAVLRGH